MPAGPAKGQFVNLDPMLDEYYEARGWDKQTGLPTAEKLKALGLKEVADDMKKIALSAKVKGISGTIYPLWRKHSTIMRISLA